MAVETQQGPSKEQSIQDMTFDEYIARKILEHGSFKSAVFKEFDDTAKYLMVNNILRDSGISIQQLVDQYKQHYPNSKANYSVEAIVEAIETSLKQK
jgi:hypothetical protein